MDRSRRKSKTPSRRDLRSGKGAFTLVELLIVIVILGLLMALLVPSLRGVWSRYNMTRCQTNLSHIYQAFRLRVADEAMGVEKVFRVEEWDGVLMSYLENDISQFKCPEEGEAYTGVPIEDKVGVRVIGSNAGGYLMLLVPGPWSAKLSVTQWNDAGIRDRKLYDVPPYVADGNPDTYYFIMEDWHDPSKSDYDYDISIKVTEKGDGTTTLVFKQHGTGASYQVLDLEDGTVLKTKADMDGGANGTIVVNTVRPGETNYGMNKYARDVGGAGGKILVMDYSRYVAEPDKPDDWTDKLFDPSKSGVPLFARHFGMANVLFSDGSVQPKRVDTLNPPTDDINPIAPTTAMKWWMP